MPTSRMETLLHKTRLQILWAIAGREMTPQEIAEALPDVAQATLYRHLNRLADAGVLKVVRENRARGAVEKVYAIVEENSIISREEFMTASREDHYRYFQAFLASISPGYHHYVQNEKQEKIGKTVSYGTTFLYLSKEDAEALTLKFREAVLELDALKPGEGKRRYNLTTIFFPATAETDSEDGSS